MYPISRISIRTLGRATLIIWFASGCFDLACSQDQPETPFQQTNEAEKKETRLTELRIYEVQNLSAPEVVKTIRALIGESNSSFFVECDHRLNHVVALGTQAEHEAINNLLQKLDAKAAKKKVIVELSPVEESVNDLRNQYAACEEKALQLATRFRETKISVSMRSELIQAVKKSFDARQALQKAEIYDYAKRIQEMQRAVDSRQLWSEKIVERRVDELLDPSLNWNASKEETLAQSSNTALKNSNPNPQKGLRYSGSRLDTYLDDLEKKIGTEEAKRTLLAIRMFSGSESSDLQIRQKMEQLFEYTQSELDTAHVFSVALAMIEMGGERNLLIALDYCFKIAESLPQDQEYEPIWNAMKRLYPGTEEKAELKIAKQLEIGSRKQRSAALNYLEKMKAPVVSKEAWTSSLLASSMDEDPSIRIRSINQFKINYEGLRDRLLDVLNKDPQTHVQHTAVIVMDKLDSGHPQLHQKLMDFAKSQEEDEVYFAISVIGSGTRKAGVDELIELLSDPEWGLTQLSDTFGKSYPREMIISRFQYEMSKKSELIEVLKKEERKETRETALKTIDWIEWILPEKPIAEAQGRWKLTGFSRNGEVFSPERAKLWSPLEMSPDEIITIDGLLISANDKVLGKISHGHGTNDSSFRMFVGESSRFDGVIQFVENKLRIQFRVNHSTPAFKYEYTFERVEE